MTPLRAYDVQPRETPTRLLTIPEAARELRCSKSHLYRVISGKITRTPPLPVFHIGRRTFIRSSRLHDWIRAVESREMEMNYATGCFGVPGDDLEYMAGA